MEVKENPLSSWTEDDIKARMGTIITKPFGFKRPGVANGVPATFDARD
jgi:hypothetical protein